MGKFGTIIVEFYATEQFERPVQPRKLQSKKYIEQPVASDCSKKFFSDSLFIKKGKEFSIP